MKKPQDILNKIDSLLYSAGFTTPFTLSKVENIIEPLTKAKRKLESKENLIEDAKKLLTYGMIT